MAGQDLSEAVLKESLRKRQRRWVIWFILVNCFYIVAIVGLVERKRPGKENIFIFFRFRQPWRNIAPKINSTES